MKLVFSTGTGGKGWEGSSSFFRQEDEIEPITTGGTEGHSFFKPFYCGLVAGCWAGGFWFEVPVAGFEASDAGFLVVFFFDAGFLGGSVSSTTTFLGGSAAAAVCAVFNAALKRVISASFDDARFSMRSASCFRADSNPLRSFETD